MITQKEQLFLEWWDKQPLLNKKIYAILNVNEFKNNEYFNRNENKFIRSSFCDKTFAQLFNCEYDGNAFGYDWIIENLKVSGKTIMMAEQKRKTYIKNLILKKNNSFKKLDYKKYVKSIYKDYDIILITQIGNNHKEFKMFIFDVAKIKIKNLQLGASNILTKFPFNNCIEIFNESHLTKSDYKIKLNLSEKYENLKKKLIKDTLQTISKKLKNRI